EEEFNIDALLASPVPAKKKSKKRRKLPPDLSSDRHKDHRDGHGVEANYF
ncbi:N118, partial [Symbiodinium microadriaticum]